MKKFEETNPEKPDQIKKLKDAREKADKFFDTFMNAIAESNLELVILCFELRLADTSDDHYTTHFLGLINEKRINPLLHDIIMDNKKSEDGTELFCTGNLNYKFKLGNEFKYVMKYTKGKPFAIEEK